MSKCLIVGNHMPWLINVNIRHIFHFSEVHEVENTMCSVQRYCGNLQASIN